MKARLVLLVAGILGVLAYLIYGPGRLWFGRDARSSSISRETAAEGSASRPADTVLEEREASHRALEAPRSSDLDESLERFRSRQETIALRDGVEARTIAFKGNSAEVSSDGIAKLKRIALLQRASKTPITLIGSKRDDTALTTERLEQTKKLLIQNGVKETVISTIIEELAVEQPHTITVLWRVPKQPPEGERPPLRLSAHP